MDDIIQIHTQLFWDQRYKNETYIYGTKPNDFLAANAHLLKPKSNVLCIAEGEGRNAVFLAKQGHQVSAFDISVVARQKAQKLAANLQVQLDYTVLDINDYDFSVGKWDAIISIFAHTNPEVRSNSWYKIAKALKKGGLFIFEAYHPKQLQDNYQSGGPKDMDWLVGLNDIKPYFDNLEMVHAAEIEREVQEGLYHNGQAFVSQFICRG